MRPSQTRQHEVSPIAPLAARLSLPVLLIIAWVLPLNGTQGQSFIRHPQAIEGPWEVATASGVYGVFFDIDTWWHDRTPILKCPDGSVGFRQDTIWHAPIGPVTISQQSLNISLYFRAHNTRDWGWCDGYRSLDNNHLVLYFHGLRADLTFHPDEHQWVGSWSTQSKVQHVTFTRPHLAVGVHHNRFVGDWQGVPIPSRPMPPDPTSLHIRESADGTLEAWLDRVQGAPGSHMRFLQRFQRSGWPLKVVSAKPGSFILETEGAMPVTFRYVGRLSPRGSEIRGAWIPVHGERLPVSSTFYRLPLTH